MPALSLSARLQAARASPRTRRLDAALSWWLAETAALFGDEPRADRAQRPLLLRLSAGEIELTDGRTGPARVYRIEAGAEDLAERIAAIRGPEREPVGVKVLVDPAACFTRSLTLPAQALPRMREVLAQELEAATPFKADAVHADWYVESEAADGRVVVRHVVLKRAALDPLLATLSAAGIVPGPVTVGHAEDRAMPVDLLCGGRRQVPSLLRRLGPVDLAVLALSAGLLVSAFATVRSRQEAALDAMEAATRALRATAISRPPAAVGALATALDEARAAHPPVAATWDALATLPSDVSLEALSLSETGATATLLAPDATRALQALAAIPVFEAPRIQSLFDAPGQAGKRVTVAMDWRRGPSR